MEKKGKRSRRKAVSAADRASIVAVLTKMDELIVKITKSYHLDLFSQAANELREGIQLIETTMLDSSDTLLRMNLQARFIESKVLFYSNLVSIEFSRNNFDDAIQIYKKIFERGNLKMKLPSPRFHCLQLQYHEALLRQGKGNIDTFISLSKSRITLPMKHDVDLENDLRRSADFLRTTKHFDAAAVLGEQLEELCGDKFSLATTYLEQYIIDDKSLQQYLVDDKEFLPEDFVEIMTEVMQKHQNEGTTAYVLVLAQATYLLHQLYDDTKEARRKAICFIEKYLDSFSIAETRCITCGQAGTPTEVQLVCSGCRVACYCSIDHQRMTWKKEVVRGMRFGHEVLCPVMKAYRKWRHANDNGGNKRVSRLRRRFERECLYFLSDGLGLKDICFE
ncbi:predicted protein [Chaetoceros tenuissimus]|uniref:MYND-type domain-containing protein n=1 Tax=Chaetoceros tenuissimus TaxID=426638 RepID=A0AAD3D1P1_9STRA|nr:predicted protein [Chaetoceros tenuissimus]